MRWSYHAAANLAEREILKEDVEQAVAQPEFVVDDSPNRQIYMRRYFDSTLQKQMLLRVVAEETESGPVIVTVYKTSRLRKYIPRSNL